MAFLDKLFKFKKKPFGGTKPAQVSVAKKSQLSKPKKEKEEEAHGSGKLAHVIIRPHISEKSSTLQVLNKYIFEVNPYTTKHEVKRAIKDLYGVLPTIVKMINIRGKQLRFGKTSGQTKRWKKAIVTLPAGKTIDVYKK